MLGESIYGSWQFRDFLVEHWQSYVLGVTGQQRFWVDFKQVRVDKIVKELPQEVWIRHSIGDGTKGPRVYDWTSWAVSVPDEANFRRYALARRSITDPENYAYYFCYAPDGTPTETFAEAAGKRWNMECCFETAKQETGLDEYEIRSWHGWYRHITMSMVALTFLSAIRSACQQD